MEIIKEENKVYILNEEGKEIAYVTFPFVSENTVEINHTFVDDSLRGMGVASSLMASAYEVISQQGYRVRVTCSYAKSWLAKHPEKKLM